MVRIIDVVSHVNVMPDELTYREPQQGNGDFRMGSRVIVGESQIAVFVRQGQMLDALEAGSHTLNTGNIPLLAGVIGMFTSGNTPFTADVYFVNTKDMPSIGWGTNPPIIMYTPDVGVGFQMLMTNGIVDIGIEDPARFLKNYGVGRPIVRLDDIRDRIQTMLLSTIGQLLSKQKIANIQEANAMLGDLEAGSLTLLNDQFLEIGMRIKAFRAKPFQARPATPEEVQTYGSMQTYQTIAGLDIAKTAAGNEGLGGSMAGAGVGFGVGQQIGNILNPNQANYQQQLQQQQLEMQKMMMEMLKNQAAQNAPAAPAPAPTPATPAVAAPQSKAEIQAMLDSLDLKLASGEINQATYDKLTAKWEERLKGMQ
jgi:membrane protease subunit (stomatin/prohibitin family)